MMLPLAHALGLAAFAGMAMGTSVPNVVLILTDDQDAQLQSLDYMPKVHQYLSTQGTQYLRHYATVSQCCPSRVSFLTGKAAHNTNVTNVELPYGGYTRFIELGWNEDWLPLWIHNEGYNAYYSGKLMNGHNTSNYNSPFPSGFAGTRFFVEPGTYSYLAPMIQKNDQPPKLYPGEYSTDVLNRETIDMLDDAVAAGKPFFLTAAPIAPHTGAAIGPDGPYPEAPTPADRHKDLYPGVQVPRTDNFNPDVASGASWIAELPIIGQEELDYNDWLYRRRLQSLAAVDDMVEDIVNRLDHHGMLENTYLIFTSDQGFHIGQHRMPPGKCTSFEEDINVPMVIRGPGVPAGRNSEVVTTHTDLAPTILNMLDLSCDHNLDGVSMPFTESTLKEAESSLDRQEHVNVEFWGQPFFEGRFFTNYSEFAEAYNTYKSLRVHSKDYSLFYSVWCNNQHELYDSASDPGQMNNLYRSNTTTTLLGRPIRQVANRLDAALFVLKTCKGEVCIKPWDELQPNEGVHTLAEALDSQYDGFYESYTKIHFDQCEYGYIAESEGPMWEGSEVGQ